MVNFTFALPTVVHFGEGQISHLSELRESGTKVLLVYGGGSIKKSGIYDKAVSILKENGLEIFELSDVEPNPHVTTCRRGIEIIKKNNIDMILAIGGGSVMDASKLMAAGAKYPGDAWDLVMDSSLVKGAIPVYCVVTIAGTGSEMNIFAVITNWEINVKKGLASDYVKPKMAILDPTYTYSVSKRQTAATTADMMSHTFENYFTNIGGADVQMRISEALLKVIIKNGPIAMAIPDDYDARANLMWAATQAINGLISLGSKTQWSCHAIEHELSAYYDVIHGEGLAVVTPRWMRYVLEKQPEKTGKFACFARNVWDIIEEDDTKAAMKGIEMTEKFFFETLGIPSTIRGLGIKDSDMLDTMAEKASKVTVRGYCPLEKEDVLKIYNRSF